ncbi:MAG: helix-turn-helix transcriptional regulator [Polyangiaceae bacterium]|nr:helix-turn-helix transcriptional regulator [Polyangiaceae bacterium]
MRPARRRSSRAAAPGRGSPAVAALPLLAVPTDLVCARLRSGGEEYLVLAFPPSAPGPVRDAGARDSATLTLAERCVAAAAAEGHSNREIARARGVAERTVANQLAATFVKLGVGSRAELCAWWYGTRAVAG